ncbi:hypothetical protein MSG28_005663 [Choristoneura fumiferana]|uniref:Uncharacterized protein n=1 Tax=Choristoneura fumiferana TaxID=7141 RepID=A0ACC0L0F1_CHOFU|nr:hypothetical protein MSG28_005663 [Choristoneura fumiferana]
MRCRPSKKCAAAEASLHPCADLKAKYDTRGAADFEPTVPVTDALRSCPAADEEFSGRVFATAIIKTSVVHVLRHLRLEADGRLEDLDIQIAISVRFAAGYNLRVTPRKLKRPSSGAVEPNFDMSKMYFARRRRALHNQIKDIQKKGQEYPKPASVVQCTRAPELREPSNLRFDKRGALKKKRGKKTCEQA